MPALLINCPAGQVAVLSSLKMKSEGRNRLTSFSCPVAFFSDSGSGLDIIKHTEIKRREDWLAAITAAKLRLEQRQQEADTARGRSENDQRKPRGKDGKPKGGRYTRDFGVPKDNAQESFTDTDNRIMKRAGGGVMTTATTRTRRWTKPRSSWWPLSSPTAPPTATDCRCCWPQ